MRGILWRWLFFLGTIFWISLCLADYHQKYLQMNMKQPLKNMEIRIEPPSPPFYQIVPQPHQRKLAPPAPALTFWKFLSIVLSVSAIVIIKRLSTFRKKGLSRSSCSDFDLIRAPYGSFITRIPPINPHSRPIYHQEFQVARLETSGLNAGDNKPPALIGVKIVQKKLEDLENNIATLKQRISSNSASNRASTTSDSIRKTFLGINQTYFGPVISTTDTHSSASSNSPRTSEMKTGKETLFDYSIPVTPNSFDQTDATDIISAIPSIGPSVHIPEKKTKFGTTSSRKEVKSNQGSYEFDNDIISLKELKDSMSAKIFNCESRKVFPINIQEVREEVPGLSLSSKTHTDSKYLLSESKTISDSKTNSSTFPSISSRKSHNGSTKSFPLDGTSTTKFTDTNSTCTLTSIKKKHFLKHMKNKKKELKDPISKSIATYLAPNFPSPFPHLRYKSEHPSSYAAINKKKTHTKKETRAKNAKMYDQISVCSSNDSTDSIDKFVAKIMKPESDIMILKHSSDDMSLASTSISSLTASSSTFISGGNPKFDSVSNTFRSIRSILPLSRTTVTSNFSSFGNSKDMPAGAEPLSSGESLVEKNVSKYASNLAIHSLAMNYLQTLERKKFEEDSQEKLCDTGSEFSIATKSVLEKYKSKTKTKDSSADSSHQNILEDKYWLLHW